MARSFHITALAAAAAAALAAGPAAASTVGAWEIGRTGPDACMMSANFGSGDELVTLALLWHAGERRLEVLAAGRPLQAVRAREGQSAPFELDFDGQVPYSQWLSERASFASLRGGIDAIVGDWGSEHSSELAAAVTNSQNVTLRIGDTNLGSFDLSDADGAYRALLRCGENA